MATDTNIEPLPAGVSGESSPNTDILTAAKGGGITFVGTMVDYGGRFLLGIIMARSMGADQYGLYSLSLTTQATLAGVAMLALGAGVVRHIAFYSKRGDQKAVWGTLQLGFGLVTITSLIAGVLLFALAGPIANELFHDPRLVPLLRVLGLAFPLLTLAEIASAAVQGFKRMQFDVIARNFAFTLIKLVLIVALAVAGLSALEALSVHILAVTVSLVLLIVFLNKLFPLRRPIREAQRDVKQLLGFSLPLYLSRLLTMFGGSIQMLLLGALSTTISVGVFAVVANVSTVGRLFHNSIVTVSMPIVSELSSKADREQLGFFYQTMTKWTFAFNLPQSLAIVLFSKPILAIFGNAFVLGSTALIIMTVGYMVDAGTGICGVIINMTGHTRLNLINSVLMLALTLGLNLLLIPRLGVLGAAVAASAATVFMNLLRLAEVYLLFRLLPYNKSFLKPIVAGLAAVAVVLAMGLFFSPEASLVFLILHIVVLWGVYALMIQLLGLSPEDKLVLKRLGRRANAILPSRFRFSADT